MKEKKFLKSEFHDGNWRDIEVVPIAVNLIWQSVPVAQVHRGKEFYPKIKADIQENGLKFPLLVVRCTYDELLKQKEKWKDKILPIPTEEDFYGYVVWGGSNRHAIAKELEYDYVDCVLYDTFEEAHKTQKIQREPYKDKYYK